MPVLGTMKPAQHVPLFHSLTGWQLAQIEDFWLDGNGSTMVLWLAVGLHGRSFVCLEDQTVPFHRSSAGLAKRHSYCRLGWSEKDDTQTLVKFSQHVQSTSNLRGTMASMNFSYHQRLGDSLIRSCPWGD